LREDESFLPMALHLPNSNELRMKPFIGQFQSISEWFSGFDPKWLFFNSLRGGTIFLLGAQRGMANGRID
jgi:hypothetical protein